MLVLMGLIPVAAEIGYENSRFSFRGKVGIIRFQIGRGKEAKVEKETVSILKKLPQWPVLWILLKNAYTTLCHLAPRVWIGKLKLHITAGGPDPANTALLYGAAGMALETLSSRFAGRIEREDLRADVDFALDQPEFSGCINLCLCLYQALWGALRFSWGAWREYHRLSKGSISTHDESAAWRYDGHDHG